jgi:hypothetical protein
MKNLAPADAKGKDLLVGDWVLVIAVPLSIHRMADESKRAFSRAVGNTFEIVAFDKTGCLELYLWPKVGLDTIWIEPSCVSRFRRYKQLSKSFQQKLELNAAPLPPRYELKFDIRLKDGVNLEKFAHRLIAVTGSGGFAVWPEQRRVRGSVYAEKSDVEAIEKLENARMIALKSKQAVSIDLSDIVECNEI